MELVKDLELKECERHQVFRDFERFRLNSNGKGGRALTYATSVVEKNITKQVDTPKDGDDNVSY